MASAERTSPDELSLGRLEAFSDGVFAIAITLLVLELSVESNAGDHLLTSILHEWPALLAYVTSFSTIGAIWLAARLAADTVESALAHQPSFLLYGLGITVSLLFPTVGVGLYLGTALYLAIPGRTIRRLLRGPLRPRKEAT